jgi:ParB family chromosome partitioning protein
MARIMEVRQIPLSDLEIGKGQVRTSGVGKDIDELVDSIRKIGQLEPIVVSPPGTTGKYEILTGQRRFLAHRLLHLDTIWAAVLDEMVDTDTAKVISLTENLIRRDLNLKELIDACTALYKKYGSIQIVAQETGLPASKVSEYVKYDQLVPELKALVDTGLSVQAALRAQRAAMAGDEFNAEEAVRLAKAMSGMSGAQQRKVVEQSQDAPDKSIDDLITAAQTTAKITQITVTLSETIHSRLQKFASEEGTTQDDAAALLIQEGLSGKGYL